MFDILHGVRSKFDSVTLLIAAVVFRLLTSYPITDSLLAGHDFTSHASKIWFLSAFGDFGWNAFWYGGFPLIKIYPPLSYLFAAPLATLVTSVMAAKIVMDLFYIIAPLAFYIFLKNFNMSRTQRYLGTLIFSVFPTHAIYMFNGALPTVVNMTFIILFWHFTVRYMKESEKKYLFLSGIFFSLSILVHQLTAIMSVMGIFAWVAYRYRKFLVLPLILGASISAIWLFPFLTAYHGDSPLKPISSILDIGYLTNPIAIVGLSTLLLVALVGAIYLDRDSKAFILVLFLSAFVMLISTYHRVAAIAPIPAAFILAKFYGKGKVMKGIAIGSLVIFLVLILSYNSFYYWNDFESPEIPLADDRVVYYPMFVSAEGETPLYAEYLAPLNGQKIITGSSEQTQRILGDGRVNYHKIVSEPLELSDSKLHELLDEGFVNTVIVRRNYPEYIDYFSSSSHFERTGTSEDFEVFRLTPPSSYLKMDDKAISHTIERSGNDINIQLECISGTLTIKETWDDWWNAYVNGKEVPIGPDLTGFMVINLERSGACEINLKYRAPLAYPITGILLAALAVFYFGLVRSSKDERLSKVFIV